MTKRTSSELKRLAREFLTGNYAVPILTTFLASILPGFCLSAFPFEQSNPLAAVSIIYFAAAFILHLLGRLLTTGVVRIHLLIAKKQPVSLMDLFWAFRHQPDRYLLGAILLDCVLLIPAVIFLPLPVFFIYSGRLNVRLSYLIFILCIVILLPIELYLNYTYCLIFLLFIEYPSYKVLEAFKISRSLMQGNRLRLLYIQLSFLGWCLLGLLSLGFGFLWISPYIQQTCVNLYLDITNGFSLSSHALGTHIDTSI